MMRRRRSSALFTYVYRPVCVMLIVAGLFGLVWLRSSFVSAAYELRTLEEKRTEALKEMKLLQAERSRLMALSNIDGGMRKNVEHASAGFVFPDRVRVIHVQKSGAPETHKASLKLSDGERR
ncbi:MAG: hypothetical protein OHK006_02990 [Thermodesulfovibrionales bacterium]